MYLSWILIALAVAVLTFPEWQILRFVRRGLRGSTSSIDGLPGKNRSACEYSGKMNRPVRWISPNELDAVLAASEDLIVFDLRSANSPVPLSVPATRVLPASPGELTKVLGWLPPNQSAAFCGASGLSVFMIEATAGAMRGSAPLYLVRENCTQLEAA